MTPAGARLSNPVAIGFLLIVAITYCVNAMDRIVFPTLLPAVAHEYGFALSSGGLLATIFTLGLGVAGVPGGLLFDRMSRKSVAILGIAIYSACTALTCIAVGFFDMAAYRAVSGVGEALQNAAIFTMAGAYFVQNRTLAFGLLNVAYGIGSFIGPRWGAVLMGPTPPGGVAAWRTPLAVYAGIGFVGAAIMLLVSKRFSEQRAVVTQRSTAAERHIPPGLLNRNTLLVACASVFGGLASFGYLGLYPTYLRTELHFTLDQSAAAASMYGAGALMGLLCGYMADRMSQKLITMATLVVLAVDGYSIFNVATTPGWQEFLSFIEGTASSGFLYVNNYSLMQRSVRADAAGRASGLVVSCVYLPAAVSGYMFALLQNSVGWGNAATLQMALLLIIPLVAMAFFDLSQTSSGPQPVDPAASFEGTLADL